MLKMVCIQNNFFWKFAFKNCFLINTDPKTATQRHRKQTDHSFATANHGIFKYSEFSKLLFYILLLLIVVLLLMALFVCRKKFRRHCSHQRHLKMKQTINSSQTNSFFSIMSHSRRKKLKSKFQSRMSQNIRSIESLWRRSKVSDRINIFKLSTFNVAKSRFTSSNWISQ